MFIALSNCVFFLIFAVFGTLSVVSGQVKRCYNLINAITA